MDKFVILFLLILTVLIKLIFIDNYCYNTLRLSHSKTYIKKNYSGIINKIFYKKFFREIGIFSVIVNCLILLTTAILVVILFVSFFYNLDIIINIIICIYSFIAAIYFLLISFDFIFLNKNSKGEKSSFITRFFVGFIFLAIAILYLIDI